MVDNYQARLSEQSKVLADDPLLRLYHWSDATIPASHWLINSDSFGQMFSSNTTVAKPFNE